MNHTETLTRYTANFVDELANNGLTDVVISPGSRSTPLAMTFTEHKEIKQWVIVDERSAAFFALGLAKQTMRPVALVCTSGTAAANYFPAIVEAFYSRVPLVVLTADRPHELRDVGAPQAIDQTRIYGNFTKWYHEMALPEATPQMLLYARKKAARAIHKSQEGNAGPVHLNFPFREPLVPDFTLDMVWGNNQAPIFTSYEGIKQLSKQQLEKLVEMLANKKRGVIVCGPQTSTSFSKAVVDFASAWNLPILADPLSQVRSGTHAKTNIIEGYDSFLRNAMIREQMKPDFILRFGAMPVSKPYLFFVKEHHDVAQYVVENSSGYRDPAGNPAQFIYADPVKLCDDLTSYTNQTSSNKAWLSKWQAMNDIAKKYLRTSNHESLTEGEAVRVLFDVIPHQSSLFVGNSMAIRDVDTFFMTSEKQLHVLGNRGTNGIDGVVSSGLGVAASGTPVTLVIGDLSFYHDLNGLLAAKQYELNITVLLINNNGGGIFSFLPQSTNKEHFEALFGTPLHIDFQHAVEMYGGYYKNVKTENELHDVLAESYRKKGFSVIEVKTDRAENADWHRNVWKKIENEILTTVF